MAEPIRDIANYAPETVTARDRFTLEEFTWYLIPMRMHLLDGVLKVVMEAWDDAGKFNQGMPSSSPFNSEFSIDYATAKADFPDFFTAIETSVFGWLGASADDFYLEVLDINLTNLQIKAQAQHKTFPAREIKDQTNTLQQFEDMKTTYPNLVQAYYAFCRTYSKQQDARLTLFN